MDEKLKQKLIEAVKAGDENQASELLWQLVIDCQNCPFKTVSGLPFSYTIKRGRNGELTKELWILHPLGAGGAHCLTQPGKEPDHGKLLLRRVPVPKSGFADSPGSGAGTKGTGRSGETLE